MIRQKAVDFSTGERRERKEYLIFTSEWYGYDYFGAEIKMGRTHIEGKYLQQVRKLVNKLDMKTGRMNSWYELDIPRVAFNIPFSKENVDKYPLNPHPFGPDSENITDPNQVGLYKQKVI